jgi:zinc protease
MRSELAHLAQPAQPASPGAHVLLSGNKSVSVIDFAYRTVAPSHPDYWGIELLAHTLAATPTSPTWMALRHRAGLAYHVAGRAISSHADSQLRVTTWLAPEHLSEGLQLLERQIERARQVGVSDADLARGKRTLRRALDLQTDTNAEAAKLVSAAFALGDPVDVMKQARRAIDTMTARDLQSLARRYLQPDSQVLIIVGSHAPKDAAVRRLDPTYHVLER